MRENESQQTDKMQPPEERLVVTLHPAFHELAHYAKIPSIQRGEWSYIPSLFSDDSFLLKIRHF